MSLSNTQYDEIQRSYQELQIRHHHLTLERIAEVYSRDHRLKEIDDAIATASLEQARLLLDGDDSALEKLRGIISSNRSERLRILNALGYDENYLHPPFACNDCKDTGYIGGTRCHCFRQKAIDSVYLQSNIRNILEEENFEHFSYQYFQADDINPEDERSSLDTIKYAVEKSKQFIDSFDQDFSNILFFGSTGVGKTFLSNCIAKELLDTGHSVIYFTALQLFTLFEKNIFHKDTDAEMIRASQDIFDCDLLIIDDLGTELPNSFTSSQLFLCLNERILRRKSTIISTNLSLDHLMQIFSERTFSRISKDFQFIKMYCKDIRVQKRFYNK
ncbi:MAG: ATP-binding protein [Lachnospiraceae bacterium]